MFVAPVFPDASPVPRTNADARVLRTLATHVRAERKRMGFTVEEAAELAGVDPRHWQKVERGETAITVVTLAKLARALEVTPGHLLG